MKTLKPLLILVLLIIQLSDFSYAAMCTATSSGNWSNPAIWSCGSLPGCGDFINVPAGITVTVDMQVDLDENSSPACSTSIHIQVFGILQFVTGNKINLACGSGVEVMTGGTMLPGGGGGSSNWLKICEVTEWKTSDGPVTGYKLFGSPSPLPVEFVSFDVEMNGNKCQLSWEVASERDNDHFTVEYSLDGYQWNKKMEVKSIGNHFDSYVYTALTTIETNNTAVLYFRLKQTDIDGKEKLLDQKSSVNAVSEFLLYPNPAKVGEAVHLKVNSTSDEKATVYFYNSLGQMVAQESINLTEGPNVISFNHLSLKRGVYLIKIPSVAKADFFRLIID
jgi:hypothetical protein